MAVGCFIFEPNSIYEAKVVCRGDLDLRSGDFKESDFKSLIGGSSVNWIHLSVSHRTLSHPFMQMMLPQFMLEFGLPKPAFMAVDCFIFGPNFI
jgi:hypothetical protein